MMLHVQITLDIVLLTSGNTKLKNTKEKACSEKKIRVILILKHFLQVIVKSKRPDLTQKNNTVNIKRC